MMVWGQNQFIEESSYDFSVFFFAYIYRHAYSNYIICIADNEMKGLCLSFNLVSSGVVYVA